LRKHAIESVRNVTEKMVDSVNQGVAHVFANQRKLEGEARKLQTETSRFARQTTQWLQLVDNFNVAIKVCCYETNCQCFMCLWLY
jgi:biogenesis of lysosome-related organelles complex 1 subunit 1